jgi:hypothetical protein
MEDGDCFVSGEAACEYFDECVHSFKDILDGFDVFEIRFLIFLLILI